MGLILKLLVGLIIVGVGVNGQGNKRIFSCDDLTLLEPSEEAIGQNGTFSLDEIRILMGCRGDAFPRLDVNTNMGQMRYGYTFDQLKAFFETYGKRGAGQPRPINLCVTSQQAKLMPNSRISKFVPVLEAIERYNQNRNNPPPLVWVNSGNPPNTAVGGPANYSTGNPISAFSVRRIYNNGSAGRTLFKHWAHVVIGYIPAGYIDGVIVQAVDGALGIPIGEFVLPPQGKNEHGNCGVKNPPSPPDERFGHYFEEEIVPCKYRPRANFRHPSIALRGPLTGFIPDNRRCIHVHFNWLSMPCQELIALQFLIISIPNMTVPTRFNVQLSPVFEFFEKDQESIDGLPTAYHPTYEEGFKCAGDAAPFRRRRRSIHADIPAKSWGLEAEEYDDEEEEDHYDETTPKSPPRKSKWVNETVLSKGVKSSFIKEIVKKRVRRQAPPPACRNFSLPCNWPDTGLGPGKPCVMGYVGKCYDSVIIHNKEYFDCVVEDKGVIGNTCPPGPFTCDYEHWKNKTINTAYRTEILTNLRKCSALGQNNTGCHFPTDVEKNKILTAEQLHDKIAEPSLFNRFSALESGEAINVVSSKDVQKSGINEKVLKRSGSGGKLKKKTAKNARQSVPTAKPHDFYISPKLAIQKEFEKIGEYYYKVNKRLHGAMEIFAFLVLFPCAVLVSRYFKETPEIAVCGLPVWLVIHIVVANVSIVFMWIGFIATGGNSGRSIIDCDKLRDIKGVKESELTGLRNECYKHDPGSGASLGFHITFGSVAFLVYHFSALIGWYRPSGYKMRMLFVYIHAIVADFVPVFGAITGFISNKSTCKDVNIIIGLLLVATLISYGAMTGIQMMQDRQLGIKGRSHFPIVEGIEVRERAPYRTAKKIVAGSCVVIHLVLFLLLILFYVNINAQDKDLLRGGLVVTGQDVDETNPIVVIGGFFTNCESLNTEYLRSVIDRKNETV